MKKMSLILGLLFYTSNLFGMYEIKLAVYKDYDELMLNISKIKKVEYKNSIVVNKKNSLHYACSKRYKTKIEANYALKLYKDIFTDAFIKEVEEGKIILLKNEVKPLKEVKQEKNQKNISSTNVVKILEEKIQVESQPLFNMKNLLQNKTVYLCCENEMSKKQRRIVKMDFKTEYVNYNPLKNTNNPLKVSYVFRKNQVLLNISGLIFTHEVYAKNEQFIAAKSFVNGKQVHGLRYFFTKEDALAFMKNF